MATLMGARKKCKVCNLTKALRAFPLNKEMQDGRRNECKICRNAYQNLQSKQQYKGKTDAEKEVVKAKWRAKYVRNIKYHQDRHANLTKTKFQKMCSRLAGSKRGAKQRGFVFELTQEEFFSMLLSPCKYCACPEAMGVDRFNNSIGYTISNSVPCCTICNRIKLNHDYSFLMNHIKRMLDVSC